MPSGVEIKWLDCSSFLAAASASSSPFFFHFSSHLDVEPREARISEVISHALGGDGGLGGRHYCWLGEKNKKKERRRKKRSKKKE